MRSKVLEQELIILLKIKSPVCLAKGQMKYGQVFEHEVL